MIGLMVDFLAFFYTWYGFSSLGSWCGANLGNGYGIQGQNYPVMFHRNEMWAEFHYGKLILGM